MKGRRQTVPAKGGLGVWKDMSSVTGADSGSRFVLALSHLR